MIIELMLIPSPYPLSLTGGGRGRGVLGNSSPGRCSIAKLEEPINSFVLSNYKGTLSFLEYNSLGSFGMVSRIDLATSAAIAMARLKES